MFGRDEQMQLFLGVPKKTNQVGFRQDCEIFNYITYILRKFNLIKAVKQCNKYLSKVCQM